MIVDYSSFSKCGQYYCHWGLDGKLKIWETGAGTFKQEYIPNLHLKSTCTCLNWIAASNDSFSSSQKKKRKSSDGSPMIAMGTRLGTIVLYSVAEGGIVGTLHNAHKTAVRCISWEREADLFTCANDYIVHWNVSNKSVRRKWKIGTDSATAMQVSHNGKTLLTASRNIKWWDVETQTVIKVFTGHVSPVFTMTYISVPSGDDYVISAAQNDRLLNAWSLNASSPDKSAVAAFTMTDLASNIDVMLSSEGVTSMVAVTKSGAVHFYSHQLNGKCTKPLKPALTLMIASDAGQNRHKVSPIIINAAKLLSVNKARISYGQPPFLAFENVEMKSTNSELCLVRKDPKVSKLAVQQQTATKVKSTEINADVEYISPAVVNGASIRKRSRKVASDVPMEERLENLALHHPSSSAQPTGEGMTHLLIQGLHSKDRSLLQNVLFRRDEAVIVQTVQRLPVQLVGSLIRELITLVEGKTYTSQVAAQWLKAVLSIHAGQILADNNMGVLLGPLLGLVETRLSSLSTLCQLRGRLDLLLTQISGPSKRGNYATADTQALLVYQDQESSDDGSDILASEVEDENDSERWDELSEEEDGEKEEEEKEEEEKADEEVAESEGDSEDDVDMSS